MDWHRCSRINSFIEVVIDAARLAAFPAGCRHVAYVQALGGATVPKGLIEPGSTEEQRLCEEGSRWLMRE